MFLVSFISAFLVPSSNDCFSFSIAIFLVNSRVPPWVFPILSAFSLVLRHEISE